MVDRFIDDDLEQDFFDHSTPPITLAVDDSNPTALVYLGIGTPTGGPVDINLSPLMFTDVDVSYSPIIGGGVIPVQRFRYSVFNQ
jgi:hypothetical protein